MSSVDAEFVTKKTVKGRVVAEFLAENPIAGDESWELEFPNEHLLCVETGLGNCTLMDQPIETYFDGSANRNGAGAGIVIEAPNGEVTTMCKRLLLPVTNNMAEYEACIMGMETLLASGAKEFEVIGDSLLVIEHANERWKVEEERLKPYFEYLLKKAALFDKITFTHIGRIHNRIPDALANLASAWQDLSKVESEEEPWFTDILRYMRDGTFFDDATKEDHSVLRKMALNYVLPDGELYRRAWDGMLLRCMLVSCYIDYKVEHHSVEHHHSSPYRPQANGAVEAANKEIKRILSKMCECEPLPQK
ncbi:uncharacterized protein LOC119370088 [Jatropha curcas]|uniref:uncharacterized protein LOC119370088 n=1 Tax=Jatropha curcas TaxID=180498 RepID=UPI00189442A1|nr:uncharacterized protein LOC119370088 [Jatropha curcas]